jgi:hypothetical protein
MLLLGRAARGREEVVKADVDVANAMEARRAFLVIIIAV